MDSKKTVSTLNDLIATCRNGQNGFKEAAENVKSPDLKSFFNQVAADRTQLVRELEVEVRNLGGDPEKTGSPASALHSQWIEIKGTLTGKSDQAILSECERGEDSAVKAYQDAIKGSNLPANILTMVERQFKIIQQTHDRVTQMREAKSATSGR